VILESASIQIELEHQLGTCDEQTAPITTDEPRRLELDRRVEGDAFAGPGLHPNSPPLDGDQFRAGVCDPARSSIKRLAEEWLAILLEVPKYQVIAQAGELATVGRKGNFLDLPFVAAQLVEEPPGGGFVDVHMSRIESATMSDFPDGNEASIGRKSEAAAASRTRKRSYDLPAGSVPKLNFFRPPVNRNSIGLWGKFDSDYPRIAIHCCSFVAVANDYATFMLGIEHALPMELECLGIICPPTPSRFSGGVKQPLLSAEGPVGDAAIESPGE
jgi:hypothetical protein